MVARCLWGLRAIEKGRAPLEALPVSPPFQRSFIFRLFVEALPLTVPSKFAGGTGDASIDKVSQRDERQCQSDHGAPSFQLARHIDPRVATQMRVLVFALEVSFAGVNVSFIPVVKVVLRSIIGHGITSMVDCFVD
ncbi:hypothetical protein DESC_830055 [Desulfosarcina cetonica]|nr:hypothetical protein DESC_830055 [Desulfosarcina cetonica]